MAILVDAVAQTDGSGTNATVDIDITTDADRFLLVGVYTYQGGPTPVEPTGTFDTTQTLTVSGTDTYATASDDERCTVFKLTAPNSGLNTISISTSASQDEIIIAAVSYTGVDQTTPIEAEAIADNGTGTTTSISNDVSSETGDLVVDFVTYFDGGTHTAGALQTRQVINDNGATNGSVAETDEAGAGTVTMSHTWTSAVNVCHWRANLNQAVAANPKGPFGHPFHGPLGGPV